MTVRELYDLLHLKISPSLSEIWDNDGLMCCPDPEREVQRVLFALDVTDKVVEQALRTETDVIISHHPFVFAKLGSLTTDTPVGNRLVRLIKEGVSVFSFHTRFDRVAEIAQQAKRIELVERFRGENPLFIAGSTWGPDEELLIPLMNANPEVRFVIAPHEMDQTRINHLISQTAGGAVRFTQCDEQTDFAHTQLLILDTMGMLSSVYGYASWGYIGGGFGVGIHNTLEAATFGLPIAFGPNYRKFKEACDLLSLGAAASINNYEELAAWFTPLRDEESLRIAAGRSAKEYTQRHLGATRLILRTIFSK